MTSLANEMIFLAQAQPPPGGGAIQLLFIVFMFAAMWFLIIAPQRKKQKQHAKMISELAPGDEVITAGGIYGEITAKKDDRFVIRIADGVKIEVSKPFVQELVKKK